MIRAICWAFIVVGLATVVGLVATSCSSNPVSWIGQGVPFETAADQATERKIQSTPFKYYAGPLSFWYDDAGTQRKGWVTVSMFHGVANWFVSPGQCESAPAGWCATKYGVDGLAYVVADPENWTPERLAQIDVTEYKALGAEVVIVSSGEPPVTAIPKNDGCTSSTIITCWYTWEYWPFATKHCDWGPCEYLLNPD